MHVAKCSKILSIVYLQKIIERTALIYLNGYFSFHYYIVLYNLKRNYSVKKHTLLPLHPRIISITTCGTFTLDGTRTTRIVAYCAGPVPCTCPFPVQPLVGNNFHSPWLLPCDSEIFLQSSCHRWKYTLCSFHRVHGNCWT